MLTLKLFKWKSATGSPRPLEYQAFRVPGGDDRLALVRYLTVSREKATGMISAITSEVEVKLPVPSFGALKIGRGSGRNGALCGLGPGITRNIEATRVSLENLTQDSGPDIKPAPMPWEILRMGFDSVFKAKE